MIDGMLFATKFVTKEDSIVYKRVNSIRFDSKSRRSGSPFQLSGSQL